MASRDAHQAHHEALTALADKYLDEALRNGDTFSEGLCNWALTKAQQEIGDKP